MITLILPCARSLFSSVGRFTVLPILLLMPALGEGQHRSVRSGVWSSPASWESGVVPPVGGRVEIAHDLVVDVPVTVGDGQLGVAALLVRAPGSLRVAPLVDLTLRGNAVLDDATLFLSPGSVLEFDSSTAADPLNTNFSLQIGAATDQRRARLVLEGLPGSRCAVRSVAGAGAGYLWHGGYRGGGLLTGQLCDFVRLGNAAIPALDAWPTAAAPLELHGCTFQDGGMVRLGRLPRDSTVVVNQCRWSGTQSQTSLSLEAHDPLGSGQRILADNVFDREVWLHPARAISILGNVLLDRFSVTSDAVREGWAAFAGNFVRNPTMFELLLAGSTSGNYWYIDPPLGVDLNPHFVQALTFGEMEIRGDIFEYGGADGNGDCVIVADPPMPALLTIQEVIVLPNAAGENSGTLFSALGGPNASILAEHNTYFTGSQGAAVGETYAGHRDMLQSFRSNIGWDHTPRGFLLFDSGTNNFVPDLIASGALGFNVAHNLWQRYGNLEFSSGAAGGGDQEIDPQFVDPTRNLAAWDLSLGGPGSVAHAIAQLGARHSAQRYDARYSPQSLIDFVRAGFRPQNPLLVGSAHDGGTIGAVPFLTLVAPTATPTTSTPLLVTPTATPTVTPSVTPSSPLIGASPTATPSPSPTPSVVVQGTPEPELLSAPRVRVRGRRIIARLQRVRRGRYVVQVFREDRRVRRYRGRARRVVFPRLRVGDYRISYVVRRPGQGVLARSASVEVSVVRRARR